MLHDDGSDDQVTPGPAAGTRLPGWALALAFVATGALLAWLHVIVLFGI